MQTFRRYAAAVLLALATLVAAPAMAQTLTATVITPANLGNVAPSNTGVTVFQISSNGAVTRLSGTGLRKTVGNVTSQVSIACSSAGNQCNSVGVVKVKIVSSASVTGKAGQLTNFTVSAASGSSGLSVTSSTSTTIDFSYTHTGGKVTPAVFNVGMTFPVSGYDAGAVGTGNAPYTVYPARSNQTPGPGIQTPGSGNATVYTYAGLTLGVTPQLNFGTIAKPSRDPITNFVRSSVITMNATSGVVSATGVALTRGSPTLPIYSITGEPNAAISVTPAASVELINKTDASKKLTVTLTPSTLPTTLNGAGARSFSIGGNFTVDSDTALGEYEGAYSTTVSYN